MLWSTSAYCSAERRRPGLSVSAARAPGPSGPGSSSERRAIVSFAWVAGPPLATFIIGTLGDRAILITIAAVAVLNIATTAAMISRQSAADVKQAESAEATNAARDDRSMSRAGVVLIVTIFIVLQATNSSVVSIMSLFVTETLGLDVIWAGIALGVAAGLEIPALLLIGRLTYQYSSIGMIASGCLAGIAYYTAMVWVSHPVVLVGLQALDAWFFAVVAGVGLTVFQRIISRPGLASGLFVNTRRIGAIASGAIISLASQTALGYGGVFAACAALTVMALIAIGVVARMTSPKPVLRLSGR